MPEDQSVEAKITSQLIQPVDDVDQIFSAVSADVKDDILVEAKSQMDRIVEETGHGPSKFDKLKNWFRADKRRIYVAIAVLPVVLLISLVIPKTRYPFLNALGLRVSSSILVLDDKTTQPLPGATVSLDSQTLKTGADGKAKFVKVKQGKQTVKISKTGYVDYMRNVTLGYGENPLGDATLNSSGTRVEFEVKDWVSDGVIKNAVVSSGDSSAVGDDRGLVSIVLAPTDNNYVDAKVKAAGFLEKVVSVEVTAKDKIPVTLTPDTYHYYASKQDGSINAYRERLDGQNQEKILVSSPRDKLDSLYLSPSESAEVAVFISTVSGEKNAAGYFLYELWLYDGRGKSEPVKIDTGEQIIALGWVNGRYIYVKTVAGVSAGNPKRSRLMSFDPSANQSAELASSNYFSGIEVGPNVILYAQAGYYGSQSNDEFLYKIKPDGTGKALMFKAAAYSISRTNYSDYKFASVDQGVHYTFNSDGDEKSVKKVESALDFSAGKVFTENVDHSSALWVDDVDGQGALMLYDIKAKTNREVLRYAGLKSAVALVNNDYAMFRVVTVSETADYVVSLKTDKPFPKKIRDVSNVQSRVGSYLR
jgi:hypothetical protein